MNLLFLSFQEIPSPHPHYTSALFRPATRGVSGSSHTFALNHMQSNGGANHRLCLGTPRQISHTQTQTGAAIREHPTSERPKDHKAFAAMKQMRRRTNQLKSTHWKPLDCGTFYHNAAAACERVPLVAAVAVCSVSSSEAASSDPCDMRYGAVSSGFTHVLWEAE